MESLSDELHSKTGETVSMVQLFYKKQHTIVVVVVVAVAVAVLVIV